MSSKYTGLRNGVAVALCVAAVVYIARRSAGPAEAVGGDQPQMVEVRGAAVVMGFSTQWGYPWLTRTFADPPLVVPLRDGDILHVSMDDDLDQAFIYRKDDGPVVNLWFDGPLIRVNNRPNTLILNQDALKYLATFSDEDVADLQLVIIESASSNYISLLRRLAVVNPHVGIAFGEVEEDVSDDDLSKFRGVLASFQPWLVVCHDDASGADLAWPELIAGWTSIETLIYSAAGPNDLEILAGLSRLRNLTLIEWDPEETGPLPPGLDGLTTLTLFDSDVQDLECLVDLPGLTQLKIAGSPSLTNLAAMAGLPDLRRVALLSGEEPIDIRPLFSLKKLEYVSLPPGTTEKQLSSFVEQVPGVRWVDLMACGAITNLSSLASLDQLDTLSVHAEANLDDLATFDNLRFLTVLTDSGDDEQLAARTAVAKLEEALPDCHITTTVAPCLGSGYLLILAPVALAAGAVVHRTRRGRRRAAA